MSPAGLRSTLRNAAYLASARGVNILARAVYVVALAHFLGPELYGLFAYGTSWYLAFLPLASLGLDMVAAREVGRQTRDAASLVKTTFALRAAASLLVALACVLLAWRLEQDPQARTLLSVFACALIGRSLAIWADDIFIAYETARDTFRLHLLFRPAEVAVGMAVLLAGGGIIALALAHTLVWWLHALVSLGAARRLLAGTGARLLPGPGMRALLVAGIPLGLVALLQAWLMNGPLVIFRQSGGNESDLGQLSLAVQILLVTAALGTAASKATLPILSRAAERGDSRERLFAEEALRLGAWLGLAAWLTAEAWGGGLLALLFGPRYAASGTLLAPMLALLYPLVGGFILVHALMARRESWRLVWLTLAGAAAMTGPQPWLHQRFGLNGVIIAMAAGYLVWMLGLSLLLNRRAGLRLGRALLVPWLLIGLVVTLFQALAPFSVPIAFFTALLVLSLAALAAHGRLVAQLEADRHDGR